MNENPKARIVSVLYRGAQVFVCLKVDGSDDVFVLDGCNYVAVDAEADSVTAVNLQAVVMQTA